MGIPLCKTKTSRHVAGNVWLPMIIPAKSCRSRLALLRPNASVNQCIHWIYTAVYTVHTLQWIQCTELYTVTGLHSVLHPGVRGGSRKFALGGGPTRSGAPSRVSRRKQKGARRACTSFNFWLVGLRALYQLGHLPTTGGSAPAGWLPVYTGPGAVPDCQCHIQSTLATQAGNKGKAVYASVLHKEISVPCLSA